MAAGSNPSGLELDNNSLREDTNGQAEVFKPSTPVFGDFEDNSFGAWSVGTNQLTPTPDIVNFDLSFTSGAYHLRQHGNDGETGTQEVERTADLSGINTLEVDFQNSMNTNDTWELVFDGNVKATLNGDGSGSGTLTEIDVSNFGENTQIVSRYTKNDSSGGTILYWDYMISDVSAKVKDKDSGGVR